MVIGSSPTFTKLLNDCRTNVDKRSFQPVWNGAEIDQIQVSLVIRGGYVLKIYRGYPRITREDCVDIFLCIYKAVGLKIRE